MATEPSGAQAMRETLARREFLKAATAGLAAGFPATVGAGGADPPGRRAFTMDLACGAIGVQVPLPEAIALAKRFGFEAVDPDAGFLAKQEAPSIETLRDDLKAKGLVWGAAGLPVDFRGDDARFQADLKGLPATAAARGGRDNKLSRRRSRKRTLGKPRLSGRRARPGDSCRFATGTTSCPGHPRSGYPSSARWPRA